MVMGPLPLGVLADIVPLPDIFSQWPPVAPPETIPDNFIGAKFFGSIQTLSMSGALVISAGSSIIITTSSVFSKQEAPPLVIVQRRV